MTSTALVIPEDSTITFQPRALTGWAEAVRFAKAFDDGAYITIRKVERGWGVGQEVSMALQRQFAPTYTDVRDFLYGDCNVDYRLACRVAFRHVSRGYHYRAEHPDRQVGWL